MLVSQVLIISLIVSLGFVSLFLVGCNNDDPSDASNYLLEDMIELHPEIQAIVDRGVLRVGVRDDMPGMGYFNAQADQFEGLEIELAHLLAERLLGDRNAIEFIPVTTNTRGTLLDRGALDMVIATFAIREERKEFWNFSQSYLTCPARPDSANPQEFGIATRLNNPYLTGVVDDFLCEIITNGTLDILLEKHDLYSQCDAVVYLYEETYL